MSLLFIPSNGENAGEFLISSISFRFSAAFERRAGMVFPQEYPEPVEDRVHLPGLGISLCLRELFLAPGMVIFRKAEI